MVRQVQNSRKPAKREAVSELRKIDGLSPYESWIPFKRDKKKLPEPFELVLIQYDDGKTQTAWWTGANWDSGREIRDREVTHWKKSGYYNYAI